MDQLHYFAITFTIGLLFKDNPEKDSFYPAYIIMEVKDNDVFTVPNIEFAKKKAIKQLSEVLSDETHKKLLKEADTVYPVIQSVSYLGCGTHSRFLGALDVKNKEKN